MKKIPINGRVLSNSVGVMFNIDASRTLVTVTYRGGVLEFATRNTLTENDKLAIYRVLGAEGLEYFPIDDQAPLDPQATTKLVNRLLAEKINI